MLPVLNHMKMCTLADRKVVRKLLFIVFLDQCIKNVERTGWVPSLDTEVGSAGHREREQRRWVRREIVSRFWGVIAGSKQGTGEDWPSCRIAFHVGIFTFKCFALENVHLSSLGGFFIEFCQVSLARWASVGFCVHWEILSTLPFSGLLKCKLLPQQLWCKSQHWTLKDVSSYQLACCA